MTASTFGLLFPGQGSQVRGMGRELFEEEALVRDLFGEASEALSLDLAELCFEDPLGRLAKTEFAQPALLTCSVAAFRVLEKRCGLTPAIAAGHSLGEISALTCAGVFHFPDAVRLVAARGRLMQGATPLGTGGMAAVFGLPASQLEHLCSQLTSEGKPVVLANYNSSEQAVLSGPQENLQRTLAELTRMGGVGNLLNVSIPAHSPWMQPAAAGLREELSRLTLRDGRFPVISTVDAQPYQKATEVPDRLVRQLTEPVQWLSIMQQLSQQALTALVEAGPKTVLRDLFKLEFPRQKCFSVGDRAGLEKFEHFLQTANAPSAPLDTRRWPAFVPAVMAAAVAARNACIDSSKYRSGVVEPYQRLRELHAKLRESGQPPTDEQLRLAAELLRRILRTKRVAPEERSQRFAELFAKAGTGAVFMDFEP